MEAKPKLAIFLLFIVCYIFVAGQYQVKIAKLIVF